jgi:hypothetical protein
MARWLPKPPDVSFNTPAAEQLSLARDRSAGTFVFNFPNAFCFTLECRFNSTFTYWTSPNKCHIRPRVPQRANRLLLWRLLEMAFVALEGALEELEKLEVEKLTQENQRS